MSIYHVTNGDLGATKTLSCLGKRISLSPIQARALSLFLLVVAGTLIYTLWSKSQRSLSRPTQGGYPLPPTTARPGEMRKDLPGGVIWFGRIVGDGETISNGRIYKPEPSLVQWLVGTFNKLQQLHGPNCEEIRWNGMHLVGHFNNGNLTRGEIYIALGSTSADGKLCPYSLYSGTFNEKGELHGEDCSVVSADGNMRFSGLFEEGACVKGIQEFPNEGVFLSRQGTFVGGLLDGPNCTERLRNGEVRTGIFTQGFLVEGEITDPQGHIVLRRGTFKANELHGNECFAQLAGEGTYLGNFDEGIHVSGERRGGACFRSGATLERGQFTKPELGRSFVFGNDCRIEFANGNVWEVEISEEGKVIRGSMSYTRQTNPDISNKTGLFYMNTIGALMDGVLSYHDGTLVVGGFDAQGQRHGTVYIIEGEKKTQATYENGSLQRSIQLSSIDDLPKQYHQYLPESINPNGRRPMVPSSAIASYMRTPNNASTSYDPSKEVTS